MDDIAPRILRAIREVTNPDLRNRLSEEFHTYTRLTAQIINNITNQYNYTVNGNAAPPHHNEAPAPPEPNNDWGIGQQRPNAPNNAAAARQAPPPRPRPNQPRQIAGEDLANAAPAAPANNIRIAPQQPPPQDPVLVYAPAQPRTISILPYLNVKTDAPTMPPPIDDIRLPKDMDWKSHHLIDATTELQKCMKFPRIPQVNGNAVKPYPRLARDQIPRTTRVLEQPEKALTYALFLDGAPSEEYERYIARRHAIQNNFTVYNGTSNLIDEPAFDYSTILPAHTRIVRMNGPLHHILSAYHYRHTNPPLLTLYDATGTPLLSHPIIMEFRVERMTDDPVGLFQRMFAVYHPFAHTLIMCNDRYGKQPVQVIGRRCLHAITADAELVNKDLNTKFGSKFFPKNTNAGSTSCERRTGLTLLRAHAFIYTPPTP